MFSVRCKLLVIQRIWSGEGARRVEVDIIVIIIPAKQAEKTVQSIDGLPARGERRNDNTQHRFLAEVSGRVTVS